MSVASESPVVPPIPRFDRGVPSDGGPLLPAIARDADGGDVLMLAWMNREAYEQTVREKAAVYYSRSRRGLWRKGDTSGHRQAVVSIRTDCDADAIVLDVRQTGAACHEGYRSCFFRTWTDRGFEINQTKLVDPQSDEPPLR